MKNRLLKTSKLANEIVNYLINHPKISEVSYPTLPTHPSHHNLKTKYFTLKHDDGQLIGPDIFSFLVDEKLNTLIIKLKKMHTLNFKTSYGGSDTRIDCDPVEINGKTWCRISIGYDDFNTKIIDGLCEMI
jgi:cystathionine beta-lyase/cystathionine gamma-synthase